jgi:type I restriction enzyme S subunit
LHYEKFADGTVKCIEEEIPFELPEGWEWERLGNISNIARGGSPRPIESYITDDKSGINWIKIGDTEKDGKYIYTTKEKIKKEGLSKSRYVESDDFLLTNSMSFGRPYILKTNGCIHDGWLVIGNIKNVFNQDYLYYALSSNFMYQTLSLLAAGSTVKNLKSDTVKSVLFPIPPMKEQQEIANAVNRFMEYVVSIEKDKTTLLETIQSTKSKILDLAIRGKLVPQDPNDEPASVLLERISTEKEELIKQGKIKRDKRESVIFKGEDNSYYEKVDDKITCIDEEIPFEIPDSWIWCRLENCCNKEIKRGKSPKYAETGSTLVFAQKCNTKYSGIDIGLSLFLDNSILCKYPNTEFMQDGDIVINSTGTGTLGRVGIYRSVDNRKRLPIVPDSHITIIRTYKSLLADYVYAYMKASQSQLEKMGEGSTNQKELKPLTLKNFLIPISPKEEQKAIASKVTTLFSYLDSIAELLD